MSELPPGWVEANIGDLTEYISRGKSPKYTDHSELPVVNQKAIRWFGIQDEHLKYVHPDQFEQWTEDRFICDGDILWNSTGTGTIGRACLVKPENLTPPKVVDSHVTIVRPFKIVVDPRYLFAWIRGPEVQREIEDLATGTTNQIELSRATVAGTTLPLAPLNEQKRIADKLDAVLAQVDACRERLDRVPALLKHFRQAVLAAATSGKLTEEWAIERGERPWELTTLGSCGVVSGGLTKNANRQSHTLKKHYLRVANVYANRLDLSNVSEIGLTETEHAKTRLRPDDLLIVEGNGSLDQIGRVALWNGELEDCVHQNHLIRWRSSGPSAKFILFWLLSPRGRSDLSKLASTTTGLHTLSISKVSSLPIQLPSLPEQHEIVRRVEALFAYADRLEARYTAARAQVERLTPALLAKAFRGELVAQDPGDEPAAVLVERLRAARAAAGEPSAARRRARNLRRPAPKAESLQPPGPDAQGTLFPTNIDRRDPLTA